MPRGAAIAAAILAAALLSGCAGYGSVYGLQGTGLLFTHIREPLTMDLNRAPVPDGRRSQGTLMEVQLSGVRVNWSDNSIGSIAKSAGLKTLYYADIERTSILGFWTSYTVFLYGEKDETAGSATGNQ